MQSTSQPTKSYRVLDPEEQGEIMIGLRNNKSIRSIASNTSDANSTPRPISLSS
jgi:hypothetical protein